MLNKTQKIAISKNFIISVLFICLIFAAIGLNVEDSYAAGLNEKSIGTTMKFDIEDKLGNSQASEILEVDRSSEDIITRDYVVDGRTFQDIQNAINGAQAGDTIYLAGDYSANGRKSQIIIDKTLTLTSVSSATLDGEGISSIFNITSDAPGTVISNLKFVHGEGHIGTAMFVKAKNVVVDNCIFEDNHADYGGALSSEYSLYSPENLTIQNCQFRNNSGYFKDFQNFSTAGAVGIYGLNSKLLNCIFDSNWVKGDRSVFGGAIQIGLDASNYKALVYNCTFINNAAIALTKNSHGGAGCVRNGVEYIDCVFINNTADQGGALTFHASGKLQNCTLINNTANQFGGAVSGYRFDTNDLEISDCYFEGNSAPRGGAVHISGLNIDVINSTFNDNYAKIYGGALNIVAKNVRISDSRFDSNTANVDGGAIYTIGENTIVNKSLFVSNEARPDYNKLNDGLGGAIYINSTRANVCNSEFYYNTARNGSAIYYDKYGNELSLNNNTLFENQAWVYLLPIYANDIYYGQTEKLRSVIHGGNNIAKYNNLAVSNAIYNAADYSHLSIDGESPLNGATNSGQLYQDDREYNMKILLTVEREDGLLVYNRTLNSNYLGEVSSTLRNLEPGKYYVTARHSEDTYYKAIVNTTTFTVFAKVDNQVRKLSSSETFNYEDIVVWTLNITNNGPNKATNVTVSDVLPKGLIYVGDDSDNAYNPQTGTLYIGDVDVNQTVIVNIYARINKTGEIVNNANVTSDEYDVDLTNNYDEASITVPKTCDLAVVKSVNNSNPNYGDLIKWTIVVRNNGPDAAHAVVMRDVLPKSLIYINSTGNYNSSNGKWNIGTLGVNKEVTLEIICRVNATGTIQNKAYVSGREIDRDESNNNDSCKIKVNSSSDLAIEKSINVSSANFGDEITWRMVITNNGPSKASGVKVYDALPDGLVYIRSVLPRGTYSNGVINVGTLAVGERLTYEIVCRVNKTGLIINVANITGNQYDYNKSNNEDNASVQIKPAADLEVTKTVNVTRPNYGEQVCWNIVVRNNGPDTATNVVAYDLLPDSLIWVSDDSDGKYDSSTGIWTIGKLNSKKSVQLNIITRVNATGITQNNVSVKGTRFDYDLSNNQDDDYIYVSKTADVGISKSVNNSNPKYGDIVKWILVAKNNGPDNATSIVVEDILPKGLVLVEFNASKGIYDNGIWGVCCLENGEEQILEIVCKVNKTGTITNFVSISADEVDLNPFNNNDSESIKVPSTVDLEVTKQVSNKTPYFGDDITWFISVKNNGPDRATNVVVSDVLDDGLILRNYSSSVGTFNDNKWSISRLNNGQTAYINITCTVNKLGKILNEALAICSQVDRNESNNNDSEMVNVNPVTDLSIEKIVNNSNPNYGDLIKWSIIVRNNGPNDATEVAVNDIMPSGVEIVESSEFITLNGTWYVGDLALNEVKQLDIICKVISTGNFENIAIISGKEHDPDPSNNRDVEDIDVAPACDLSITKTASKYYYKVGDVVDYSIKLVNNGPDEARNIMVNEMPDNSLILKSVRASKGNYDDSNQVWTIDSLGDNEYAELYINAMAEGAGIAKNMVSAVTDTFDYNRDNNQDDVLINVSENDEIPKNQSEEVNSTPISSEREVLFDESHVTANPLVVLVVSVMFSIIFLGVNFSKKR